MNKKVKTIIVLDYSDGAIELLDIQPRRNVEYELYENRGYKESTTDWMEVEPREVIRAYSKYIEEKDYE
jgi:hypothetical protein